MDSSDATQTILRTIDKQGYFCTGRASQAESELCSKMRQNGELVTLADLGIKFMNEAYIYLRVGNPMKVEVKTSDAGRYSYLDRTC